MPIRDPQRRNEQIMPDHDDGRNAEELFHGRMAYHFDVPEIAVIIDLNKAPPQSVSNVGWGGRFCQKPEFQIVSKL